MRGHNPHMGRISLILMALILAVVTTAVPAKRAGNVFSQLADAGSTRWQEMAAQDTSGPRGATIPFKRCPVGAGMLSCPFYPPSASVETAPSEINSASVPSTDASILTGRSPSPPSHPPKTVPA